MNDFRRIVAIAVLAVGIAPAMGWAGDGSSSTSQPASERLYQRQAAPASPGGIIGYEPLPRGSTLAAVQQQAQVPPTGGVTPLGIPATSQPRQYHDYTDYTAWIAGQGPYTLGRDDVIHIEVQNQPDFTGDFIVGPDGQIQYDYLGDIPVAGMTKQEVEQVLSKLLERYVRVPVINVVILAYNSKAVYVIGAVNRPGKYIMRGDTIKLREAIIAAGLPAPYAAMYRTRVVKPSSTRSSMRKVDLRKVLYQGTLERDIDLYPGEIVVVPASWMSVVGNFFSQFFDPFARVVGTAAAGAAL